VPREVALELLRHKADPPRAPGAGLAEANDALLGRQSDKGLGAGAPRADLHDLDRGNLRGLPLLGPAERVEELAVLEVRQLPGVRKGQAAALERRAQCSVL
jgi:hypothetical protein